MFAADKLTEDMTEIADFLTLEREKSLSEAEWRFRARGYGYNLRRTDSGVEVSRLPQNRILGTLPL
ncbi:hypothetical protein [Sagittula sp. SSi028]|uniref:hypothetical protein n=1 Tax=Sagittula sp. SSi028 TaxID=3400636 RepID=UPI003AF471A9